MRRTWRNWLAIAALATLTGTASAQTDWNQPSEIGSYQSILSRAGYGNEAKAMGQQIMAQQVSTPINAFQAEAKAEAHADGDSANGKAAATSSAKATASAAPANSFVPPQVGCPTDCATAGVTYGAVPMTSGQIMSGPVVASPMMTTTPMVSTPMVGLGSTPMAGLPYGNVLVDTMGSSACGTAACSSPAVSAAPVYASAVRQPSVVSQVLSRTANRPKSNYTVGIVGMFFQRDYEDNRYLAFNPSGDTLFTNDADEQTFDGFGVNLISRNCNGSGFEVAYWALNPGRVTATLSGANVATSIQAMDQLLHVSSGRDLYDIYANTLVQTVVRDTNINNLEYNVLRNGGTFSTRRNRKGFYELLGGFRWFEFDESLQYTASIDTGAYPGTPSDFFYNLEARNRLLGFQLGARNEICLGSKVRFFTGVKGGVFNNNIRTVQNITDINGEIAQVNSGAAAGRPFSYTDEKNDVAFLGELDFGVLYHLSQRSRLRLGYRVLGVSGVALAADQMPFLYNDPNELNSANSNGSLLLNGGYYGLEFCF